MSFRVVKNLIGGAVAVAPPKDVKKFDLDAGTEGVAGRVYYYDGGELKNVTANTGTPAVIALEDADAGEEIRGLYVTPGMIFKAQPSKADGTEEGKLTNKHANFEEGITTARFDNNGDYVDWETDPSGGCITVLEIEEDTDESWVWVTFNKTVICNP